MPGDNRIDRPTTSNCVYSSVGIRTPSLALAKRNLIDRIGTEDVLRVIEAVGPVSRWVIQVLVVGASGVCLSSPISVIATVVGHALGEGVRRLIFQTAGIALLKNSLKSVVFHAANGGGTGDL